MSKKHDAPKAAEAEGHLEGIPLVGIIMGSDSDLPVMAEAARTLDRMGVPYELTIISAHRTPLRMVDYARGAHARGIRVVIAGAGGAAHLPGMVASLTPLPVIGVPVKGRNLEGLDSLLSIVQMPAGIPVATVAVNNAANAGLLAVRILGASDPDLRQKMIEYQSELEVQVLAKASRLENDGWALYLGGMGESR
jgi:phosphoribosylaminoimidazole carboxylase PurE protein